MNRIIAALRKDHRSQKELAYLIHSDKGAISRNLKTLRELKVIHICGYRISGTNQEAVYQFGEGEDAKPIHKPRKTFKTIVEDELNIPTPKLAFWHDAVFSQRI